MSKTSQSYRVLFIRVVADDARTVAAALDVLKRTFADVEITGIKPGQQEGWRGYCSARFRMESEAQ
jgi:hypothetical protein